MRMLLDALGDAWHGRPLVARHPKWRSVRQRYIVAYPTCAACGRAEKLNVHHILPVHERPDLELVWENLMSLCEWPTWNCHLRIGHRGNWQLFDELAPEIAAKVLELLR